MKRFIDCAFKIIFSRTLIVILMLLLQIAVLFSGFTWLGNYMDFIWEGMSFLGAILIIFIINRDEPTEFKLTWIIPICVFPVFGALIYLFVISNAGGIGLKAKTYIRMKETEGLLYTSEETKEAISECDDSFKGFSNYMENRAGYPTYHNSAAQYYPLGEDKFEALLEE